MIGTGIFTTPGFIARDLGHPVAMLLCWLTGGLLALSGGLCYAELGAMFPRAGGDYVFLRESFGKALAFLSGWVSLWVGFSAAAAAVAVAFESYVAAILPPGLHLLNKPPLLAISVIILFTLVHCRGLGLGARAQVLLTSANILLILSLIAFGFVLGKGSAGHFRETFSLGDVFSRDFAASLVFVSFAYAGWNASAYLGSEIREPRRDIPRAIILATFFVAFLYVCLNAVFIYAVPLVEMQGVKEIGHLAAVRLFGGKAGALYSMGISVCLLGTLSALTITGPRVYYAMAQDRIFFPLFGHVHSKYATPVYAILLQSAVAIFLVLTAAFDTLLFYIGFVISLFSALTVLGMVVLRVRKPDLPRPYKTWGYPFSPLLFIIGNVWIIVSSAPRYWTSFLLAAGTIGTGAVLYLLLKGRGQPS